MDPIEKVRFYTVDEYFAYEASIEGKAEYRNGMIVDMAGGSNGHGQIAANFIGELYIALKGQNCIVYPSDVKVQAEHANSYLYPDVSVACGEDSEWRLANRGTKTPTLIVEVLSESTAIDDMGGKFFAYQQIESLVDYVLVDQYSPMVNVMHRNEEGDWKITSYSGLDAKIDLRGLNLKIAMADLYRNVAFPDNKKPLIQR
jgi:Uma2 family endonuclease